MHKFARCRVEVNLPVPPEGTTSRNLLVSVNGRTSNCNRAVDELDYSFTIEWGSLVFLRVHDRGPEFSNISEGDFIALPENPVIRIDAVKITLINEPGMLD